MKVSTRFRAITVITLLGAAVALAPSRQRTQASNQAPDTSRIPKVPPASTQRIYAPLPGGSWLDGELVLNNNSPGAITITPTFYSNGAAASGASVTLQPTEVRWVRLSEMNLPTGRDLNANSGLELVYLGHVLEVGAQLTLFGRGRAGTVDVPFSGGPDYRSSVQEAVWSTFPGATSVVALGNASEQSIFVTVERPGERAEQIEIGPHGTRTLVQSSHAADAGLPSRSGVGSMRLDVRGVIGSLRAIGFVEASGRFVGGIRFYDPDAAQRPDLYATNLPVADAWPTMALKNVTGSPITVTPRFLPLDDGNGQPVELAPIALAPHAAVALNLSPLVQAAARRPDLARVSVEIVNTGPVGSLVGGLSAVSRDGQRASDIPLRDPGHIRQSTGSYPWRLDGDYNTLISIMNVTGTTAEFHARINYAGGVFWFKPQKLEPGRTATFDMRTLRDSRTPDSKGNPLPPGVISGQFRWSIVSAAGQNKLNGRAEIVSVASGRITSYSCPLCCPDHMVYGFLAPSGYDVPVGEIGDVGVMAHFRDCYGGEAGDYGAYAEWWHVQDPYVTTTWTADVGLGRASGNNEGYSSIDANWNAEVYTSEEAYCITDYVAMAAPGDVQSTCAVPIDFVRTSAGSSGSEISFNYGWGSSTGDPSRLAACTVGEFLDYSPSPFPSPPFGANYGSPSHQENPFYNVNVANRYLSDTHWAPTPFVQPYIARTVNADQVYWYSCPCRSNGLRTPMYGPVTIQRSVSQNQDGSWKYTVTKQDVSGGINPLP